MNQSHNNNREGWNMTNAEAAAHFASLPPDEDADILVINGDTCSAEEVTIHQPGTNLEDVEDDFLTEKSRTLPTIYLKW